MSTDRCVCALARGAVQCAHNVDLLDVMLELWGAVEEMIDWDEAITKALDGDKAIPMRRPKFVPVARGKAMFEWDEARGKGTLVVTTILNAEMV
jgi:hypothetical protein